MFSRWIAVLPFLLASLACQTGLGAGDEGELTVDQFSDLPVPRRFQLLSSVNQSWAWRRGVFRSGDLLYEGQGGIAAVRKFLEERLPMHGWEKLDEQQRTRERIEQTWISRSPGGVHYTLQNEIVARGPRSRIRFVLRTRRASQGEFGQSSGSTKMASDAAAPAAQKAGEPGAQKAGAGKEASSQPKRK